MIGDVTMKSALATQDALVEPATVQFARNIKIELDVCGGNTGEVRYISGLFRRFRPFELGLATNGLANVSGGGALLLSLGDIGRRSAYEDCLMNYEPTVGNLPFSAFSEIGVQLNCKGIFEAWEVTEWWGLRSQNTYSLNTVIQTND